MHADRMRSDSNAFSSADTVKTGQPQLSASGGWAS